ncbi:MAG: hypothetical protein AC479_04190 [miscellaneous Crenarchaeota group-6 archaeon AD8-1]|nr:MAG: hypothetical protein AC479_04190 [miscellaneous Crenarchaeota group-6 archaeon AD8-1]
MNIAFFATEICIMVSANITFFKYAKITQYYSRSKSRKIEFKLKEETTKRSWGEIYQTNNILIYLNSMNFKQNFIISTTSITANKLN